MFTEKRKLKICFLASIEDNHSRKWIKYFVEKKHEIHWISLPSKYINQVQDSNVNFYLLKNFYSKFLNILFNLLSVKKLIKKINPDILHIHYAGVNGALGAFSGFYPSILTAYGSDILIAPKSPIIRPLIKYILKKSDLITCDAEHIKKRIVELGAEPSKIKIIYFGVDTRKFSPGSKDKNLENKLNLSNSPVVISLRNLEPIYNVESLIRAIPFVLKEFPTAKFIIAGDGTEKEKLKKTAISLKISENISFAGWISGDEIPSYLRTSDIYISTSLSDAGIASSTAEAMACGLASIITDFGDNKEWVKNGENGFLIPVKNPELLAEKIVYLLKNENLRKNFGQKSRKIIEEKNNYYREMAKMEEIYYQLAKKK